MVLWGDLAALHAASQPPEVGDGTVTVTSDNI